MNPSFTTILFLVLIVLGNNSSFLFLFISINFHFNKSVRFILINVIPSVQQIANLELNTKNMVKTNAKNVFACLILAKYIFHLIRDNRFFIFFQTNRTIQTHVLQQLFVNQKKITIAKATRAIIKLIVNQ